MRIPADSFDKRKRRKANDETIENNPEILLGFTDIYAMI
jgi:hypothetical protein